MEITSPDPHSLWEMLEHNLRNYTNRSGPDVSYPNEKAKTKTETDCFSKNDDTGNYRDFSTSPDFLCCPAKLYAHISTAVPPHCHPTSQGEQREALIIPTEPNLTARKSINISGIPRVIQECF